jgi:hypothetical protein
MIFVFAFVKKVTLPILNTGKQISKDCIPHSCTTMFCENEGGIQVLAGLALCIQTVGSFLRTHWSANFDKKLV